MYDHMLVALDGSQPSRCAGQVALALAAATGARVTACHVYGAEIHRHRFADMEPGLPAEYQEQEKLTDLRTAHDKLMDEGFRALSTGYVEEFLALSQTTDVAVESVATEGRSYVGILQLAESLRVDLIVLGVHGLGAVGDGMIGGTTLRVLRNAPCDVLVTRRPPGSGPLLVGLDGSDAALKATAKAVALGQAMSKPIHLAAAYDPDFHKHIFGTMTQSLSPERQEEVGLASQEKLHDDIINDGLGKLYAGFLRDAERRFASEGATIKTFLITGKAYCALAAQARDSEADMIVVSRYGHHRERCSRLGSNAEAIIRTTSSNVLLVGGVDAPLPGPEPARHAVESIKSGRPLTWDPDAKARLKRVPSFVRSMARRAVESHIRELGKSRITAQDFDTVAARFGMGPRGDHR
ncbi:MAG: universal stress protein [Planctomycetota bacterium]|jgi:nucleotide-binding universal stress UspA family protein